MGSGTPTFERYLISHLSGSGTPALVDDNRVGFAAFQRTTHTGVCKNEEPASPVWNYKAYAE